MVKIYASLLMFFLSTSFSFGCDIQKIDSVFTYHIKAINDSINKYSLADDTSVYMMNENTTFINVLLNISNFTFEWQGYTHQPMINRTKIKQINDWYLENRKRLNWHKIECLFKIYRAFNSAYTIIKSDDPSSFNVYEQTLDSLEAELSRIIQINTFIEKNSCAWRRLPLGEK